MIRKIFDEIKEEAKLSNITIREDSFDVPIRVGFNIVDSNVRDDIPNFYIQDYNKFYQLLNEYVLSALKFYDLEFNYHNIKRVLTYIWSNITDSEMNEIEKYINKYISFINDNLLSDKKGIKYTSLGMLKYNVSKQSIKQETPYCFKSYFEDINSGSKYSLPRISFGISNGICYIYAIQNKDSKINIDPVYNLKIKDSFKTINSSIKKYRNVTPSFVVTLTLFLSFLSENGINKIKVEGPLPIRHLNRKLVTDYRIKFETKRAILKGETLEVFKKELIEKRLLNDNNSTVKFTNCFNRLKLHFDNVFLSKCDLESGMILTVMNLQTRYSLLKEIVEIPNVFYKGKER